MGILGDNDPAPGENARFRPAENVSLCLGGECMVVRTRDKTANWKRLALSYSNSESETYKSNVRESSEL